MKIAKKLTTITLGESKLVDAIFARMKDINEDIIPEKIAEAVATSDLSVQESIDALNTALYNVSDIKKSIKISDDQVVSLL
jgi:hypothetical protein